MNDLHSPLKPAILEAAKQLDPDGQHDPDVISAIVDNIDVDKYLNHIMDALSKGEHDKIESEIPELQAEYLETLSLDQYAYVEVLFGLLFHIAEQAIKDETNCEESTCGESE